MTLNEVRHRIDEIQRSSIANPRNAHIKEELLLLGVLQAIADRSCADPAALAREVLKTTELQYVRWYG
jgi:hypothetical protein